MIKRNPKIYTREINFNQVLDRSGVHSTYVKRILFYLDLVREPEAHETAFSEGRGSLDFFYLPEIYSMACFKQSNTENNNQVTLKINGPDKPSIDSFVEKLIKEIK